MEKQERDFKLNYSLDWTYGVSIEKLKKDIEELNEQLRLHSVSNSIATEYAEFCVRCDREGLPLLCLEDYIKQYCC